MQDPKEYKCGYCTFVGPKPQEVTDHIIAEHPEIVEAHGQMTKANHDLA